MKSSYGVNNHYFDMSFMDEPALPWASPAELPTRWGASSFFIFFSSLIYNLLMLCKA